MKMINNVIVDTRIDNLYLHQTHVSSTKDSSLTPELKYVKTDKEVEEH